MQQYTSVELDEAIAALTSTLNKCQKMQQSGKLQSSQKTLNDRRVNALRIAITLIQKEINAINEDKNG